MVFNLDIAAFAQGLPKNVDTIMQSLSIVVNHIAGPVIINHKIIILW